MKFYQLLVIFFFACTHQFENVDSTANIELWYLQWEMVEKVIQGKYNDASLTFDYLIKNECNFDSRVFSQGLIAKLKVDKEGDARSIFENTEVRHQRFFCKNFPTYFFDKCSAVLVEEVSKPDLRDSILELYVIDQFVRGNTMLDIIAKYQLDTISIFNRIGVDPDLENELKLKRIIADNGTLTCQMIGSDAMNGVFYIAQHSRDLGWQIEMIEHLQRPISEGCLERSAYAYLRDRISVREGNNQLFGTQVRLVDRKKEIVEFFPIADSLNVDLRRKKYNLEPIAFYKNLILGMN